MKYTNGPWNVDDGFSDTRIQGIRRGKLCNIVTGMYDEENEPTLGELEANAHLIASAPGLLEACKQAAEWYHGSAGQGPICDEENLCIYCQAINKAEGR